MILKKRGYSLHHKTFKNNGTCCSPSPLHNNTKIRNCCTITLLASEVLWLPIMHARWPDKCSPTSSAYRSRLSILILLVLDRHWFDYSGMWVLSLTLSLMLRLLLIRVIIRADGHRNRRGNRRDGTLFHDYFLCFPLGLNNLLDLATKCSSLLIVRQPTRRRRSSEAVSEWVHSKYSCA